MFCALEFTEILCGFIVFIKFWKFSVIISSNVFSVQPPPPFRDCNFTFIRLLKVVSQLIDALFIIFVSFSLCFILDSLYCYVFNAQFFSSAKFNLLLTPLNVVFIVHIVFISRGILSMCLIFLNIWNNYNCFSILVCYFYHVGQFWLTDDSSYLSGVPAFMHAWFPLRYLTVGKDRKNRGNTVTNIHPGLEIVPVPTSQTEKTYNSHWVIQYWVQYSGTSCLSGEKLALDWTLLQIHLTNHESKTWKDQTVSI